MARSELAKLQVVLEAESSRLQKGLDDANRRIGRFERNVNKQALRIGNSIRNAFSAFGLAAGGAGFAVAFRGIVSEAASLEAEFSKVQAVTQATAGEIEKLEKVARQLGANTKFSAQQAASGITFLGQAGFKTAEIIEALPDTLDLAAAGGLSLARAADIASNVLSGFQLEAKDTQRVVDALAATASNSNTSVEQLASAFQKVAPVAAAVGISVEDTAAALGVLGNAGLQAELAGTGLRTAIASLVKPSKESAKAIEAMGLSMEQVNPELNEFGDIIETLEASGLDAQKAFAIFGREGAAAILALTGQTDELRRLDEVMSNAEGTARRMADTMGDNLVGDSLALKSAISELSLAFADRTGLLGGLRAVTQELTEFTRNLASTISSTESGISRLDAAFNALQASVLRRTSVVASALSKISGALTVSLPGTGEATDSVSRSLRSFSEELASVSVTAQNAAERVVQVQEAVESQGAAVAKTDISTQFQGTIDALDKLDAVNKRSTRTTERATAATRGLSESLRDAKAILEANLTPLERYEQSIERLNTLRSRQPGVITDDIYARAVERYGQALDDATGKTEQFRLLQETIADIDPVAPLLRQLDALTELEQAYPRYADIVGEAMLNVQDQIDAINEGIVESTEEVKSAWEELGPTFSSALEDAIVEGEKFSDVLKGLYKDILRITTRKLVTEPIGNAVSGLFTGGGGGGGGFDFKSLLKLLPGFYTGADFTVGPQTSPDIGGLDNRVLSMRVSDGERVRITPKGETSDGGNINVGPVTIVANDPSAFRGSETQIAATIRRAAAAGGRNQ